MKLLSDAIDNLDAIAAFLKDPESEVNKLTEKQLEELEYFEMADNLIRLHGTTSPTPQMLLMRINRHREKKQKDSLSIKTMYRYIADCQRLFGGLEMIEKPYWRHVMMMKEFKRYNACVANNDQKGAKGASEEMRRWGAFHINDDEKINKKDIGEKNQVLIIQLDGNSFKIDLDDTYLMPEETRKQIADALETHNYQRMIDNLSKQAEEAEETK